MTPEEILTAREGNLTDTPLPVLLNAVLQTAGTLTLELKMRQLEKRLSFEDGAPIACASNLLHETIGKYLVEKGKLTEAQYQATLGQSVSTGREVSDLLVQKGLIAPFDLYKQLQASLAHKILDCFRWAGARYRRLDDVEPAPSPLRMNTAQLVLTGTSTLLPFDVVATHFTWAEDQRFGPAPSPPPACAELRLSAKDARFAQALRARPTLKELIAQTGLDLEAAMRKLYALLVLGHAEPLAASEAPAARAIPPSLPPAAIALGEAPPTPSGLHTAIAAPITPAAGGGPTSQTDEARTQALMELFLKHRAADPFELLEVPPDAAPAALKRAFLDRADRLAPCRFEAPDLREKAEALLLALARAYAQLADPEQHALWRKRRAAAAERASASTQARQGGAAEQFKIRTALLDAESQFEEGRRRLQAQNPRGALEYFEYACDIEPRPLYRAWRAWARYLLSPQAHGRLVLAELQEVCKDEGAPAQAHAFLGEVCRQQGRLPEAEQAFRKAFKLDPQQRSYAEAVQQLVKQQQQRR